MDELGCEFTIATPAFPDNARTVFKGHLFVGDVLLSESGMRDHPLTPMTDANLVRVLQAQLAPARRDGRAGRRVGLVEHRASGASVAAIGALRRAARRRRGRGHRRRDRQRRPASPRRSGSRPAARLRRLGAGDRPAAQLRDRRFGRGRGLARGKWIQRDRLGQLLAGDQRAGRRIRARRRRRAPDHPLDPLGGGDATLGADIATWAGREWSAAPERPILVYSTASPQAVAAAQTRTGAHDVGARLERVLASVARALVERGARRLVVAGGETSGACVQALGVERLRIGRQIDPGVPWCHAAPRLAPEGLHLALKSGNFGAVDFFARAFVAPT